jgi:hypothetical protein
VLIGDAVISPFTKDENLALRCYLKTLNAQMQNVKELLEGRYGSSAHVAHVSTARNELTRLVALLASEVPQNESDEYGKHEQARPPFAFVSGRA